MAATKLTLKLEKSIIERGKALARYRGLSLSKMIEQFLAKEINTLPPEDFIAVEPDLEVLALVADISPTESREGDHQRYHEEYLEHLYRRGHRIEEE